MHQPDVARPADPNTALVIPYSAVRQLESTLSGNDFQVDRTWRGQPVLGHRPFNFHLEWFFQRVRGKPHKRVVKVFVDGPLFDDPAEPDDLGGHCPALYEHECVAVVFANRRSQYLDVAVGPHGHWLVRLFDGKGRQVAREPLDLEVQNVFEGNTWRTVFEIPLAYFPPAVCRYNAFACHGSGADRHVEACQAVSDGRPGDLKPDLHRIEFYKSIQMAKLIPDGFNDQSFNDVSYGVCMAEASFAFPNFCPNCDAILLAPAKDGSCVCTDCKEKVPVPLVRRLLIGSQTERFYQEAEERTEAKQEHGVAVQRKCLKCGHDQMSYATRQTRSADEGMTVFYTCLKCGEKEIEHS